MKKTLTTERAPGGVGKNRNDINENEATSPKICKEYTMRRCPHHGLTGKRLIQGKKFLKDEEENLMYAYQALIEKNPSSLNIAELTKEVSLLTFEISELITKQLDENEAKP